MHDFRFVGNKLFCEGVCVGSLAKKFGTPLYVYSQHTLTDHFQKLDRALAPLDHLVCFAMKSNSNLSVLRVLANLGSGFDIVSAGELRRVIAAAISNLGAIKQQSRSCTTRTRWRLLVCSRRLKTQPISIGTSAKCSVRALSLNPFSMRPECAAGRAKPTSSWLR